jgi:hypothetical protein
MFDEVGGPLGTRRHNGHYARMDGLAAVERLRALGESVNDRLTTEQSGWLADFVRAGEVEVGLEMLAELLAEDEQPLSAVERSEAKALAEQVGIGERVERILRFCPAA